MGSVVLIIRLVLAAVFVTAGVAKLLDPQGSRQALRDFEVPERALRIAGTLLPLAELATAAALVFHTSARWGGLAALVLLLAFIAGIARAISRGQAPDCHCFGQLHSAPAGRETLARNGALAALAAIVVLGGPGPAVDAWVTERTAAELAVIASAVAAGFLGLLALKLWLDNRGLRHDLAEAEAEAALLPAGLPIGSAAPSFTLPDLRGETRTLESLCARGQPVLLVFAGPRCGSCWLTFPHLRRWQLTLTDRLTVAIVSSGTLEDNQELVEEHGVGDLLIQEGTEIMDSYRVDGTPSAVVITPGGRIASSTAVGSPPIEPLVRLTLQRTAGGAAVVTAAGARGSVA